MKPAETTAELDHFALEAFLPYRLSLLSNTVSQGISSTYRNEFGLSVTEWRVIAIIGQFPGLTATEVMARGAMDKVAISRAVNKLLDKGLVQRSPHSEDRRRRPLNLTARKGLPLFRAVVPRALDYEHKLLAALSVDELARLKRLMAKLQLAANQLNAQGGTA